MQRQDRQKRRALALSVSAAVAAVVGGILHPLGGSAARAADIGWDAGAGDAQWTTPANWSGDALPAAGDTAVFGAEGLGGPVNVSGTQAVAGLNFTSHDQVYTLSGGVLNVARIDAASSASFVTNSGHIISSPLITSGSNLFLSLQSNNAANPFNLNGPIGVGGAQAFSLTKEGGGWAYLRGANLYTGATNILEGTFEIRGASGAVASSSEFNVRAGGVLTITGVEGNNNNRIGNSAAINLRGGLFNVVGAPGVNTTETVGAINFEGDSTLQVSYGSGGGANTSAVLTASGINRINRATMLVRGNGTGVAGTTSAARIMLASPPTADLVGGGGAANSFTLSIVPYLLGDSGALGDGNRFVAYDATGLRPLTINEMTTSLPSGSSTNNNVRLTSAVSIAAPTAVNSIFVESQASLTGTGTLTINSGAVGVVGATALNATNTIGVNTLAFGAREAVFHAVLGSTTVNSFITTTNGVTKGGGGELVLNAVNAYAGNTTVNDGTLTLKVTGAASTGDIEIYSNGASKTKLKFAKNTSSEAARTVSNNIVLRGEGTSVSSDFTTSLTSLNAVTLAGVISGSGQLIADAGPLMLKGDNSNFTGGVLVNGGAHLFIAHDNALGTGPLTTGTGNSFVIRSAGGARTVGNTLTSAGSLTFNTGGGNLTFNGAVSAAGRTITVTNTPSGVSNVVTLNGGLASSTAGTWALVGSGSSVGTLRLGSSTAVTGGFQVKAGNLVVGNGNLSGDVSLGDTAGNTSAGFFLDPSLSGGANVTFGGNVNFNPALGSSGIGNRGASGNVTYTGTITLGGPNASNVPTAKSAFIISSGGNIDIAGNIRDYDPAVSGSVSVIGPASGGGSMVQLTAPTFSYKGSTSVTNSNLIIPAGVSMASKTYTSQATALANPAVMTISGNIPTDSGIGAGNKSTINITNSKQVLSVVGNNLDPATPGVVVLTEGGDKTLKATNVVFNPGGKLDLKDNRLIVSGAAGATPGTAGAWDTATGKYTGVLGLVQAGRNGGAWNGTGIITTQAGAKSDSLLASLGVARAGDVGYPAKGNFGDFPAAAEDILVRYTYAGDANLDGKIDGDDYFQIDSHVGASAASANWFNGDFDYNGKVTGDDYWLIDNNLARQATSPLSPPGAAPDTLASSVTAVPEPASVALAGVAATAMLARRGRRRDGAVARGN
ncbi:MAG TPA: autotransporter-associated beta strand repeat-containing protein [Tepidisphaeraceae bacterium]|nr:autotransporter-associated beta strand repeat-containing protein [Tepidisphaeraceae bacterium]